MHVDGGVGIWMRIVNNLVHGYCCYCFLFLHQRLQGCSINSRWTILLNVHLFFIVGEKVFITIICLTKAVCSVHGVSIWNEKDIQNLFKLCVTEAPTRYRAWTSHYPGECATDYTTGDK